MSAVWSTQFSNSERSLERRMPYVTQTCSLVVLQNVILHFPAFLCLILPSNVLVSVLHLMFSLQQLQVTTWWMATSSRSSKTSAFHLKVLELVTNHFLFHCFLYWAALYKVCKYPDWRLYCAIFQLVPYYQTPQFLSATLSSSCT